MKISEIEGVSSGQEADQENGAPITSSEGTAVVISLGLTPGKATWGDVMAALQEIRRNEGNTLDDLEPSQE